jgi:hypothetical protein
MSPSALFSCAAGGAACARAYFLGKKNQFQISDETSKDTKYWLPPFPYRFAQLL